MTIIARFRGIKNHTCNKCESRDFGLDYREKEIFKPEMVIATCRKCGYSHAYLPFDHQKPFSKISMARGMLV